MTPLLSWSRATVRGSRVWLWSPAQPPRQALSVGGALGTPPPPKPIGGEVSRRRCLAVSRAGFVVGTPRRAEGGSGREAGGAAGARPRAPGGRIVFLRGAAAGVGFATETRSPLDLTAPGSPDLSSIQFGRSSHLAKAPNHGLRTRRGARPLPARRDLYSADPDLGASTPEQGWEAGRVGAPKAGSKVPKC